ncbi:hypothetical protein EYR36_001770 [Pleurotus pulmonarius]|nr:hypothetical protein EYR36_008289 [Pleurotus pulmonarius]KAF4579950.1 hypothetical protein EYR36_001770 [Pleurotus pulmonarius]
MDLFRRFSTRPTPVRTGHAQAHTDTKPPPAPAKNIQPRYKFSSFSGRSTSQGSWCAQDFMLGVGMVIIQPETEKVVLCYDSRRKHYFFPKGRKDAGEAMETAVLREAYEEVREEGTGMPDEQSYTSHLFSFEEAFQKLDVDSQKILRYACFLFQETTQHDKMFVQ